MELDKFQGIFDQGFSGIIEDNKKNIPDFMDKLAESEAQLDSVEEKIEVPNIFFDSGVSLVRANELSSDNNRELNKENYFTKEKNANQVQQEKYLKIDKYVMSSLDQNKDFEHIRKSLLQKYENDIINKYLESKIKLILNKFSYLGFENLEEKTSSILSQIDKQNSVKRSSVNDILEKFSNLEFVSNSVVKQYKEMLSFKRPLYVAASFLLSLGNIRRSFYENKEDKVVFERDIDNKVEAIRDIKENNKVSEKIENLSIYEKMLQQYKEGLNCNLSKSEISKKMAHVFGFEKLQNFLLRYSKKIDNLERFKNRQVFSTDFASSVQQGKEIDLKAKKQKFTEKTLLNFAFSLMSKGEKIANIKNVMCNKFGKDNVEFFWKNNSNKLLKNYGQLGYLFIDSNIYSNCEEMNNEFLKLNHLGKELIFSLKSNSKCNDCNLNKEGTCSKTNLKISNSPLARSSRAAKRVFSSASSLVLQEDINKFASQIKEEDNSKLISNFILDLEVLANKKRTIKKASVKLEEIDISEFSTPNSYKVDIFSQTSDSEIINQVLNKKED